MTTSNDAQIYTPLTDAARWDAIGAHRLGTGDNSRRTPRANQPPPDILSVTMRTMTKLYLAPTIEFFDRSAPPPAPYPPTVAAPITADHKSETQRAYREARTAITLLQQRWPAAFP